MKAYYVRRNAGQEIVIVFFMVLISLIGFYLWLNKKESTEIYMAMVFTFAPTPLLFILLYKLIQNKPRLIFSEAGIFMYKLNRTIPWNNVSSIDVKMEEYEEEKGDNIQIRKRYYFSVFEITERKADGDYGHSRQININETELDYTELREIALKFFKHYKT